MKKALSRVSVSEPNIVNGLIEAKITQISQEIQILGKAITRMSEIAAQIEDRLCPILIPDTPCEPLSTENERSSVPLALEISQFSDQVNAIAFNMENVLARVAL